MKKLVYCIRDERTAYGDPFIARSPEEAERMFVSLVMDESSFIHKFPEDYALYEIAAYDDSLGKLIDQDFYPMLILRAKECEING